MITPRLAMLATAAIGATAAPARADEAIATYALVLGSNAGGPGQTDLRYAEEDAVKVAAVLTELGGYAKANVDIVAHPSPQLVRDKLGAISTKISADIAAGRQARLFFYYSGHARASALDLGKEQLPLTELRQRLFAIPATLTVVVLDACQSGAFSRVKGATPAADFSFSSKQQLDARGVAVLASSSGSELSQESERLRSSYFTHHLLVGMRGAGDANHDGSVSLDEAYRYAYHQTLLATAETAVGGQHVSLEVDLKGHGEVPLSFPRKATASIELPAAMEGHALVEERRAHVVVAETFKAKGGAVRIAVAPGEYHVVVRQNDRLSRCAVTTSGSGTSVLDLGACSNEAVAVGHRKGGGFTHPMRIELSLVAGGERGDEFTQTLTNFGYDQFGGTGPTVSLLGLRRVHDHVWVGGMVQQGNSNKWTRSGPGATQEFEWSTTTVAAIAQGEIHPFGMEGDAPLFSLYARAGLGLGIASTAHTEGPYDMTETLRETHVGPTAVIGGGLLLGYAGNGGLGVTLGYQGEYSPIISNNFGQTHATGGHRGVLGISWGW